MPSYYFSYDEEGHTFYENQYELIENTPRIQDCYYYEGDVSKEDIMKDDDDYREINILEHMKKENEKLQETIKEQQKEIDIVLKERREGDEELRMAKKIIDIKECSWKTNKRLLNENHELKKEIKELKEKCK
tara:strand:- start:2264 stop:2659 length:396 start_codon:yes stop_codon:yes gene_type:complete